jgi:predicted ABC-type ATPase
MKKVYIISGPNGCGKTVLADKLVEEFRLPFINADNIALRLSQGGDIGKVKLQAGKIFLKELRDHINENISFVVETTLAGKYYFPKIIEDLKKKRYEVILIHILIASPEEAVNKVKQRVRKGGHSVPEQDVVRRFGRSKRNFWNFYKNKVDSWKIYFSVEENFIPVAFGEKNRYYVVDDGLFELFLDGIANT